MGVGLIGWVLESTETSDDPRIGAVLDELPQAIWFAFGVDLGKYVKQVHEHDVKRGRKTLVFVIVNSVEEAVKAAYEWKVDVIVAQGDDPVYFSDYFVRNDENASGIEAGGHGGGSAPPVFLLLQTILSAIPDGPPVIAAGGIATGSQIAALLTMGASGVAIGTRFLFTHESQYSQAKKDVLLSAKITDTTRSLAFDEVNRTMGWPEGCDGRAIANNIMRDFEEGLSLEERLERFDQSAAQGDNSRLVVWAGMGSGLTDKISSAAVSHLAIEGLISLIHHS